MAPTPTLVASISGAGARQHPHSFQVASTDVLTLQWKSSNATKVHIEPLGDFDASGSTEIPSRDASYSLTALDDSGAQSDPYPIDVFTHAGGEVVSPHADLGTATAPPAWTELAPPPPVGTLRSIPQPWNGRELRVWFPDEAKGKKVPLVVCLHGLIFQKPNPNPPDGALLSTLTELKSNPWAMNLGNVAGAAIGAGTVKPLVVAAPSERPPERYDRRVWANLNFARVVDRVMEAVADAEAANHIEIDLDDVTVMGWSAAGGHVGGLLKIGQDGGRFTVKDGSSHTLKLIGIADCNSGNDDFSTKLEAALKAAGNDQTIIYAIQKDNGGWAGDGYVPPSNLKPFAKGFGATIDYGRPLPSPSDGASPDDERADQEMFDVYWVDDKDNPKRTVARIRDGSDLKSPPQKPGLYHHDDVLHAAQAIYRPEVLKHPGKRPDDMPSTGRAPAHKMVPLLWIFYALPRFYRP